MLKRSLIVVVVAMGIVFVPFWVGNLIGIYEYYEYRGIVGAIFTSWVCGFFVTAIAGGFLCTLIVGIKLGIDYIKGN